jgi:hypothetical protein
MNFTINKLFILFFGSLFFVSCANQMSPQGGPKDTIPPVILNSIPLNKSTDYKGNSLRITYNEMLKLNNLKKELIITPVTESDYEFKLRKNTVYLTFTKPFKDSTTYTFNFQSSIKDITEGNVSLENTFAFSTGKFIDSIYITGKVLNLLTNTIVKGATVALYAADDTFSLFKGRPLYFTKSNDKGRFRLDNIKVSNYFIQIFKDANDNLSCDMLKEPYGYNLDTLKLVSSLDSISLKIQFLDARPISIQKALASGKYFEIGFNKNIIDYSIISLDTSENIFSNLIDDGRGVRFYNTISKDSAEVILNAIDSLNNILCDTLFIKFQETKRKKEDFKVSIQPANNDVIQENFQSVISFSKPIAFLNTDSLYIRYDSINVDSIDFKGDIKFNEHRDVVTINKKLKQEYFIFSKEVSGEQPLKVSEKSIKPSSQVSTTTGLQFIFGKGTFISVEGDTSSRHINTYKVMSEENFGIIKGVIKTEKKSFFVQLLDEKFKVIAEIKSTSPYSFNHISPGKYIVRVLVDNNNNGKWDPGDYYKKEMPEDVYFYPDILTLRPNWELIDINITK